MWRMSVRAVPGSRCSAEGARAVPLQHQLLHPSLVLVRDHVHQEGVADRTTGVSGPGHRDAPRGGDPVAGSLLQNGKSHLLRRQAMVRSPAPGPGPGSRAVRRCPTQGRGPSVSAGPWPRRRTWQGRCRTSPADAGGRTPSVPWPGVTFGVQERDEQAPQPGAPGPVGERPMPRSPAPPGPARSRGLPGRHPAASKCCPKPPEYGRPILGVLVWLPVITKAALLGSVTVAKTSGSYRGGAVERERHDRAGIGSSWTGWWHGFLGLSWRIRTRR